jgi:hypothetical protein
MVAPARACGPTAGCAHQVRQARRESSGCRSQPTRSGEARPSPCRRRSRLSRAIELRHSDEFRSQDSVGHRARRSSALAGIEYPGCVAHQSTMVCHAVVRERRLAAGTNGGSGRSVAQRKLKSSDGLPQLPVLAPIRTSPGTATHAGRRSCLPGHGAIRCRRRIP